MAKIRINVFIKRLRTYYSGILAEGQRRSDRPVVLTAQDAEKMLTAALVRTCQEMINDGYLVDDPSVRTEEEVRNSLH